MNVDGPLSLCEARDVKGMHARARRGMVTAFTGISSPYEPPESPALHLDTVAESPAESVKRVVAMLEAPCAL